MGVPWPQRPGRPIPLGDDGPSGFVVIVPEVRSLQLPGHPQLDPDALFRLLTQYPPTQGGLVVGSPVREVDSFLGGDVGLNSAVNSWLAADRLQESPAGGLSVRLINGPGTPVESLSFNTPKVADMLTIYGPGFFAEGLEAGWYRILTAEPAKRPHGLVLDPETPAGLPLDECLDRSLLEATETAAGRFARAVTVAGLPGELRTTTWPLAVVSNES